MLKRIHLLAFLFLSLGSFAAAQGFMPLNDDARAKEMPDFSITKPLPVLAPEIALQTFLRRNAEQNEKLAGYSDETTVTAELPDTKQKGEYQLQRTYTAQPKSLAFSNAKFTGDGFVKTNVITRLLQSEVDHVEKANPADTAIDFTNYKFYYKGMENIAGNDAYIFQVKPRRKSAGLFKGRFYLDVHSASLRRMEGTLAKSPSFFVKSLEFTQEFTDVDGFTFPTTLRSSAKARIIGRTLVAVVHKGYKVRLAAPTEAMSGAQQSMK
jgi:hypothetical protein